MTTEDHERIGYTGMKTKPSLFSNGIYESHYALTLLLIRQYQCLVLHKLNNDEMCCNDLPIICSILSNELFSPVVSIVVGLWLLSWRTGNGCVDIPVYVWCVGDKRTLGLTIRSAESGRGTLLAWLSKFWMR